MGRFVKGDVVVTPFPFSDLSASKKRPALVVAALRGDDVILCQITSKNVWDGNAIGLSRADFVSGQLPRESNIRSNRLFTTDSNIILYRAGKLKPNRSQAVTNAIIQLFSQ